MKGGGGATGDSVLVTAQLKFIVPVGGHKPMLPDVPIFLKRSWKSFSFSFLSLGNHGIRRFGTLIAGDLKQEHLLFSSLVFSAVQ